MLTDLAQGALPAINWEELSAEDRSAYKCAILTSHAVVSHFTALYPFLERFGVWQLAAGQRDTFPFTAAQRMTFGFEPWYMKCRCQPKDMLPYYVLHVDLPYTILR